MDVLLVTHGGILDTHIRIIHSHKNTHAHALHTHTTQRGIVDGGGSSPALLFPQREVFTGINSAWWVMYRRGGEMGWVREEFNILQFTLTCFNYFHRIAWELEGGGGCYKGRRVYLPILPIWLGKPPTVFPIGLGLVVLLAVFMNVCCIIASQLGCLIFHCAYYYCWRLLFCVFMLLGDWR